MAEEVKMAIMKNVQFGLKDVDEVNLSFDTYINEGISALQVLYYPAYEKVFKDAHASELSDLEGHACWVKCGDSLIKFDKIAKI
jgi:glycyl-tRNA synthetase alpha subunit